MTRISYSTWVKPACCVSKISSDGGCQSKETGVGMEVRLLSVGARGFSLAASRLSFAASPLNSVAPNEKKTSGTQGKINNNRKSTFRDYYFNRIAILWNNVPNDVRLAESIDSFKRKLKSFYFKL